LREVVELSLRWRANIHCRGFISCNARGRERQQERYSKRKPMNLTIVVVVLASFGLLVVPGPVDAQVVNPAEQPPEQQQKPDDRLHTWEMPPVDVYGQAPLKEDERIGDYAQPRWTADRLFGETRVYVIPKGKVEFEYWLNPETPRDGKTDNASLYEVEFGLPGRVQIDLYAVGHKVGIDGAFGVTEGKAELRWALADWGKIWGNPTLYAEWKNENNAPDHFEGKLLLGGQIASGWHWGSNFVWEHTMGGDQANSNEWTTGISHVVRDAKFDLGMETQVALVNSLDATGGRSPFATQVWIGPSLQFRPLPQVHIDVAPLIGVTQAASRSKVFVIFGWEF
jgi:hypothetical protein